MFEDSSLSQLTQSKFPKNEEIITLRKIISQIVSRKYFFIGTLIAALVLAYLYNTFTIPVYRVSSTLLIEEGKKSSSTGNDQLLEGFGLMAGMRNLDNQTMKLSSRTLVSKTLDELPFDIEFYYRGVIKKRSVYPVQPINIVLETGIQLPKDIEFAFKYLGNNMFRLDAGSNDSITFHKKAKFGENIEFTGGSFRIELKEFGWLSEDGNRKLYFIYHNRRKLVESYIKRLRVNPVSKKGSIVRISLEGTNKTEDLAFLNKLSELFLNISLDKKNNEAVRTIQFIDDQLIGISDSLFLTENKLQQFRSRNMVMNISAQGQVIIDQAMSLENEKARLGIESNYYAYLEEYLAKDVVGQVPIAPATMGIVDPGLTKLVSDLADQQGRLYSKSMGDKNPLQSQLAQKVLNTKEALKETLKGIKGANSLALKENQEQISTINAQASALPKTERQLLGIERKYKLNDELYTFLLEKRTVAQMQKASNLADNEMIDYPEFENDPVKPKKPLIYLIALVIGIGFPFLWIFFTDIFSIRITEFEEINKITDIPITGHIPHSIMKKCTTVLDEPDSPVTEAFRHLRSRMGFFTKEIKAPVILITSSMPNEGKTVTAINLASAYSLLGKKTVLVGFDLRKPKIFSDFGLDNEHGVSTWLIGKDRLEDIINETYYGNLHIITSGPIPPNPAELTTLDKTDEMIKLLKKKYDCIIIDSSPVGTVSDAFHLASLADACILVVRQNLTFKDLLADTVKDLKNSNIKGLSLLINDVITNGRRYGYGGKYRYTYNNEKSKNGVKKSPSLSDKFLRNRKNSSKIFQNLFKKKD